MMLYLVLIAIGLLATGVSYKQGYDDGYQKAMQDEESFE